MRGVVVLLLLFLTDCQPSCRDGDELCLIQMNLSVVSRRENMSTNTTHIREPDDFGEIPVSKPWAMHATEVLDPVTLLTLFFTTLSCSLCYSVGVGAGVINGPILLMAMKDPHLVAPFANVIDLGASCIGVIFHMNNRHIEGGSMINFDIVALLAPAQFFGLFVGGVLNDRIPYTLMLVILIVALSVSVLIVLDKAKQLQRQEDAERARNPKK